MSVVTIPVKQLVDFTKDIDDNFKMFKTKTRTFDQIEKLIEKIHTEVVNVEMNGFDPTYVILSWEDKAFLNAYMKYHRTDFWYHTPFSPEEISQIFGLKIIVSNVRKPKVGW